MTSMIPGSRAPPLSGRRATCSTSHSKRRDRSSSTTYSAIANWFGFPLDARRKGLQDSDAADLSQSVLHEVAQSIDRFDYDPSLGRFRNWLFVIARHKLSRLYRAAEKHPSATGDTGTLDLLREVAAQEESDKWEEEYRHRADSVGRMPCPY